MANKRGRKPFVEELAYKEVAELAIHTLRALLRRQDLTIDQQLKLALPLALKRMPDKHEVSVTESLSLTDRLALLESIKKIMGNNSPADYIAVDAPDDDASVDDVPDYESLKPKPYTLLRPRKKKADLINPQINIDESSSASESPSDTPSDAPTETPTNTP